MIQLMLFMILFLMLPLILMFLNFLLSIKSSQDREKLSPFECGFDPISNNHPPFSIHFFIISLIFLIFDIEISILIPLNFLSITFNIPFILSSLLFLLILITGLYIEYSEQSIDWKI